MSKQVHANTATATKAQPKPAPVPMQDMVAAPGLLEMAGTASLQSSAQRLGNPNLPRIQRQLMAGRIGQELGNKDLQQILGFTKKNSQTNNFLPTLHQGVASPNNVNSLPNFSKLGSPHFSVQRDDDQFADEERPTFEYFGLGDVLDAKRNMQQRFDKLIEYAKIVYRIGNLTREKLLSFSATYQHAYTNYAAAIIAARAEAQNQNRYLGIVIGAVINAGAAFIIPSTPTGWFVLTAAETATALASGTGQALAGLTLGSLLEFSGSNLEPTGLAPEVQQLRIWQTVANLYSASARQMETIQNFHRIISETEYLVGEIRTHVAGGWKTMTEDMVFDRIDVLIQNDQAMSKQDDHTLEAKLAELKAFEAEIIALDPEDYSQRQMEQDIWILWMSEATTDSSTFDLDAIEDRLHSIGVLGPSSRLNIDFGFYTFFWEEDAARKAAQNESESIRRKMQKLNPQSPVW